MNRLLGAEIYLIHFGHGILYLVVLAIVGRRPFEGEAGAEQAERPLLGLQVEGADPAHDALGQQQENLELIEGDDLYECRAKNR